MKATIASKEASTAPVIAKPTTGRSEHDLLAADKAENTGRETVSLPAAAVGESNGSLALVPRKESAEGAVPSAETETDARGGRRLTSKGQAEMDTQAAQCLSVSA
ncbi:unnamed protein product [Chondrus crispus]|uniref:Uncharacterized protein n=1 Tax=Chondrus crispus TaxID=2769 RepID=R7QG65_CHOCR|nr:unnamed protein product [Chondrus crispus]CDF37059.1 unnamed protein product [Chondrus crispus]|eukprot:XP_005716878.1 unnamed protein product [Chondrus crispus]